MNTATINIKSNIDINGRTYVILSKLEVMIENNQITQVDVTTSTEGGLQVAGGSNDGGVFLRG